MMDSMMSFVEILVTIGLGITATIAVFYRYVQSKSECEACRREMRDSIKEFIDGVNDRLMKISDELGEQRDILLKIIISLPISEDNKRNILR